MKNFLIGLAVGLAGGAITGYFVSKREFEKNLKEAAEKLEAQYKKRLAEELKAKDEAIDGKVEQAVNETKEKAEEEKKKAIVDALKRVVEEDADLEDGVDVLALSREEELTWEKDGVIVHPGSEFEDEEAEWADYLDSITEYIGTNRPYNITEEMYSEGNQHYEKVKLYLCVDEDQDYAYDADTGEVIKDYHEVIGDQAFDTLSPYRCDNAAWYIRNDGESTDYMVQYQNSALLH